MSGKKGRSGAPRGNQNARKHGFYSTVLTEAEQEGLNLAKRVEGTENEIAMLRVKIKSLLESKPQNIELIVRATNVLARMVRYNNPGEGKDDHLAKGVENTLNHFKPILEDLRKKWEGELRE